MKTGLDSLLTSATVVYHFAIFQFAGTYVGVVILHCVFVFHKLQISVTLSAVVATQPFGVCEVFQFK
jgi:hypothetical protein